MSEDWTNPPNQEPTEGQPSQPPQADGGPGPVRRYETRTLLLSMLITGIVLAFAVPILLFQAAIGGFTIFTLPIALVVGIVQHRRSKTIRQRSIWMGVVLGAAVSPIVGAGICIALINASWGA